MEKWHAEHVPQGYPFESETGLLKKVLQDLHDEYARKTAVGKNNVIWERLITSRIQAGQAELKQRALVNRTIPTWFRMDNPFVYLIVFIILAMFGYFVKKYSLPFSFETIQQSGATIATIT